MDFAALQLLPDAALLSALRRSDPAAHEALQAAALALSTGLPDLALRWGAQAGPPGTGIAAAAALRIGQIDTALSLMETLPIGARRAVLLARAQALRGAGDRNWAEQARDQARREGDAPALIAAVTLLGELQLSEPASALRTLAEGLKMAELLGQSADPHLLAVLAHAQLRFGGAGKAQRTAAKALERSSPRSPARVWALLALGRSEDARREQEAGQLGAGWWPST